MINVVKKTVRSRLIKDLFSLIPPIFMVIASVVPIFFTATRERIISVFLIAYFLTVFLIRLISIHLRNKANENEDENKANIAKANIMITTAILSMVEIGVIMLAFFFIIWQQKDKGFFASSIYMALIYSGFVIVRLIFNMVKVFAGMYTKDPYDRTIVYMETITLLYMIVISFNYLMSALQIAAYVLQTIIASFALFAIFIVCIVMIRKGVKLRRLYLQKYKEEVKVLKKSKKTYLKEEKFRKKSDKITGVEVISDDDIEYMEEERDVRFTNSDQ